MALKQKIWSSKELLASLPIATIRIEPDQRRNFESILWNDLCSEYDAQNLYSKLQLFSSGYSADFIQLLKLWAVDEKNHAEGFKIIYRAIYGWDERQLEDRLAGRAVDFSNIEKFIGDEFRLCILLAYDELATTYSYHEDIPFYRSLGYQPLEDWIRKVKVDEALHFSNLLQIIKKTHSHRISEAKAVLREVLETDLAESEYKSTFVLDHKGAPFSRPMLENCVDVILRKLQSMAV